VITPADSAPQAPGQMPASSFSILAPYAPGSPSPVVAHGDADAGGRDDVAGDVAAAQAAAQARYHEHQADTYGQGSTIGDVMTLPPSPLDPGVGSLGTTDPAGHYYDPPRSYEGNEPS
jgi:hypothetical protein